MRDWEDDVYGGGGVSSGCVDSLDLDLDLDLDARLFTHPPMRLPWGLRRCWFVENEGLTSSAERSLDVPERPRESLRILSIYCSVYV